MKTPSDFKPPLPNPFVIGLCNLLLPWYLKFIDPLSIKFLEHPAESAQFLKGKRIVVVINHSDRHDPLIVAALEKHWGEVVYCVTAREVFDWGHGILGWFFQRFGCYSVNRGMADFESIHTTEKILSRANRKLIVFPEAEVTADETQVHEVSRSFAHLLLDAQQEILETEPDQSIWIVPVGVSYSLDADVEVSVNRTLTNVERKLSIKREPHANAAARAKAATATVLRNLSEHYKFVLSDEQSQQEQVRLLAQHICLRISKYLGTDSDDKLPTAQLLYRLHNRLMNKLSHEAAASAHQKELHQVTYTIVKEFLLDLERVERLLIFERVLMRPLSPILICRIVDFLEAETCGVMTNKGHQTATIFFGKPIEVLKHSASYKSNKSSSVDRLTDCIRTELQSALDNAHGGRNEEQQTDRGHLRTFQ